MNSRLQLNSHLPKRQNSCPPKPEVLGGTVLSSTTELSTTRGIQNFCPSLNSCLQCQYFGRLRIHQCWKYSLNDLDCILLDL